MGAMAPQITSLTIVYSTVYLGANQRKHQSSASLAFVRGIPRGPVNSPHKWPVTRKMFPFDDVIMESLSIYLHQSANCVPMSWGYNVSNQECCTIQDICPKLAKSRSSITSVLFVQTLLHRERRGLPRPVPNSVTIGRLINKLCVKDISQDSGLKWVSDGYPIFQSTPAPHWYL